MSDVLSDLYAALDAENLHALSQAARALVEAGPDLGGRWAGVADAALVAGDELTALGAARKLAQAAPDHVESWLWVASAHAALGEPAQALHVLEPRASRFASSGALHRRMGRCLLQMHKPSRALACFHAALELDNVDTLAWEGLSLSKTFARGDDELAAMEELRIGWPKDQPAEKRGMLSFAIAKAYDDMGEYEAAGRRVAEGAAFFRETRRFDVDGHEDGVSQILSVYSSSFADSNDEAGVLDARPVFILAPPCAGASWLASVLSAGDNSAALPRGNAVFWAAASPLGDQKQSDLLAAFQQGGSNVLADVGRTYLERVSERAGRTGGRVIDPSGLLEMAGGAAGLCLPAAKFIRIKRDPRDLAWSIYRRRFAKGRHWTYHPDDIARVLRAHNLLCDRWAELFSDRFLTIAYEDLVTDTQKTVTEIARFAGVDPEATGAEGWLRSDQLAADPVGVRERAGSRFEAVDAALGRAGLV
jgi:tetratricopeptide (TPR) repeat protein